MAPHMTMDWIAKIYQRPEKIESGIHLTVENATELLVAIAVNDPTNPNSIPFEVTKEIPTANYLYEAYIDNKAIAQYTTPNKINVFYSFVTVPSEYSFTNRNLYTEFYKDNRKNKIKKETTNECLISNSTPADTITSNADFTANNSEPDYNPSIIKMIASNTENIFNTSEFSNHNEALKYIHESYTKKPKALIMSEVHWKYLIRTIIRGGNVLITGPSGTGKTLASVSAAKATNRPFFYFNLGATQDPRSSLIGNTHLNKKTGTYFAESPFVKAIRTENSIILLDEITRAHPDAWNILMTVLDLGQRYLRLDEKENSELVMVAKGVSFIATANIGSEYTATRIIDKALFERFGSVIEMPYLTMEQEETLLKILYPSVNPKLLHQIADIAAVTRSQYMSGNGKLSNCLSTRSTIEAAGCLYDNFTLEEAAESAFYPHFSDDGGIDSERTFIKQLVQKYIVPHIKTDNNY